MAKKKRARKTSTSQRGAAAQRAAAPDATARQRSWVTVTFEELDSWRAERNIPKKKMAEMLGVTNSTYHNWARGIAVATPNTQDRIRRWIDSNGTVDGGPPVPGQLPLGPSHSEVMETTGRIVESYLQMKPSGMSTERLVQLVREIKQALR